MGDKHPYPDSPKAACEEYAQELGFEVGSPIVFSLIPKDFSRQCRALEERQIDYAFLANLDKSVTALLQQCARTTLQRASWSMWWGFDEDVMREAGTAADGVVWLWGYSLERQRTRYVYHQAGVDDV